MEGSSQQVSEILNQLDRRGTFIAAAKSTAETQMPSAVGEKKKMPAPSLAKSTNAVVPTDTSMARKQVFNPGFEE